MATRQAALNPIGEKWHHHHHHQLWCICGSKTYSYTLVIPSQHSQIKTLETVEISENKSYCKRKVTLQYLWRVLCSGVTCGIRMATRFCKFHGRHVPRSENYEEKYERWQENHECLRRKNNRTMCHLTGKHRSKEAKEPLQSPRQKELLRRRNIIIEELGETEGQLPVSTEASLFPEESWNTHTTHLHLKSVKSCISDSPANGNLNSSFENPLTVKVSRSCKGTQTIDEANAVKKNSGQQTDCGTSVLDQEIIQLSNYLKEALHRELLLKQKMVILQELLAVLVQAADKSWKGQLNEDKLKCRLGVLENQLQICAQNFPKRSLKKILLDMEDQKQNYEQKMKESLQKLLEEKLQAERELENTQRSLAVTEEDCTLWKEHCNTLKKDWSLLTEKHIELENKLHVLENKLEWSDTQNSQLHQALQNLEGERASLYSRIDNLQDDHRVTMECLSAMEDKLKNEEREKLALDATIKRLYKQGIAPPSQVFSSAEPKQKSENHKMGTESSLEDQLQKRTILLAAKEKECTDLHHELEVLSDEYRSCLTKLRQCRDELKNSQSKEAQGTSLFQRHHDQWIPLLMAVMATAIVSYLINFTP
uniref:TRAF3-interacting JNK-activating modulator isoform X3 n=1 Tax=Pogona vitticeps TaxID=103695 RepID=A0A6J0SIW5_9SAUR